MSNCTYRFTDRDGKERVIDGQAAFKAYLVDGGLAHLLPSAPISFSGKQTETPKFKRFFGASKVVDSQGKPLVVYHGSLVKGVTEFDTTRVTTRAAQGDLPGTYFTGDQQKAYGYTRKFGESVKTPRGDVTAAYLKIENPLNTTAAIKKYRKQGMSFGDAKRKALEALTAEHDGVIFNGDGVNPSEYVVFKPTQIKSATDNNGDFDATNPDIRYSGKQDLNDSLRQKIFSDFGAAVREYSALPDAKNGKLLDTDQARELSPEYRADRSRAFEVHEAASEFTQRAFEERLAKAPDGALVVFMAGGGGAGKSSAEHLLSAEMDRANTILDGTLSTYDKAAKNVQLALDNNQTVRIAYVYREPVDALASRKGGVLERAMKRGRIVPLDALVKGHAGASEVVRKLEETFGDNPNFKIAVIDNSRGPNNAAFSTLADVPAVTREGLLEKFKNETDKALAEGWISQTVYDATTGANVPGKTNGSEGERPGVRQGDEGKAQERGEPGGPGYPVNRAAQKNPEASRVAGTSADRFKRTEQLQQAVADLQEGKITRDEYNRMVDELRPVYPYDKVPAVTTPKDARFALGNGRGQSAEKAAKYGTPSMTLKNGDWAQLRLDIPSYQEHDAWVVSVHTPKSTNREVQAAYDAGPVVGYESVAALKDVTFGMNQKAAAKIATGSSKGTIATMLGKWSPISKDAAKARADAALTDPAWTQVGMDPFRHSYFYDRDSMRPVLGADEVIQVGPLVLAKNVEFGEAADVTGAPIAFSRKQVGKETEGWIFSRDELGRFRFGAGAKAYRYAADVANTVLGKVNLAPVTPELSRALRKMKMEVEKAQNLTVDVAKNLKDLPKQEREMISDIIEGELKRGSKPPKHVLELAASMQSIMSEQSAELVKLGMLSPEAAGRWDGKYLPRFYEQKLGEETKAWMKAVKGLLGRKRTMQGITGNSLKARGMFQNVPVEDLADWEAEGWEKRDATFDPAVDTEVTVWRDFTRQERDDKGEIRDAMFRFVMGYNKSQRDIALGRLYESLAATMGSRTEQPGYVKVPNTKVESTMVPIYGKLGDGKTWVPKEVLDQLSLFDSSMQNDLTKMYLKGLSMWKEGKTVLNPVAHANNVLSNLTMAHFAGVSYWDAHKYIGTVSDLVKGSAMLDEAKEAGLFGGTFNREDFLAVMPEELKAMAQITESAVGRNVDRVWNAMSLFLRKPLGKAYGAEDEFFRYLIYRDARSRGLGVDDSVDYAQKYIFTYDDLPKTARVIRDMPVGLPFFSYTYKAIPALANTALEHPARYAAPAMALYVANAAMYAIAASLGGGEDEDWWTIIRRYMTDPEFRQRTKDLEKQERKNLPDWNKGASLSLGTEKTIRLGMDDLTNLPVFLDVSRIFPGGDLFDAHNNAGGIPLLAPLTPNNPILTTAAAMLFNKDTFRNKDIVSKTDTSAEAAQKRLSWMWKQVTPAIAVGNTHFERAMNVIANTTGQPVNVGLAEYTGIGADGLPIQPKYAAMQTVGIKARPIDLDTSEKIQASQKKAMLRDLDTEIRKLNRLENRGAITSNTAETEREKLRQKKQFLREDLTVSGDEKD